MNIVHGLSLDAKIFIRIAPPIKSDDVECAQKILEEFGKPAEPAMRSNFAFLIPNKGEITRTEVEKYLQERESANG